MEVHRQTRTRRSTNQRRHSGLPTSIEPVENRCLLTAANSAADSAAAAIRSALAAYGLDALPANGELGDTDPGGVLADAQAAATDAAARYSDAAFDPSRLPLASQWQLLADLEPVLASINSIDLPGSSLSDRTGILSQYTTPLLPSLPVFDDAAASADVAALADYLSAVNQWLVSYSGGPNSSVFDQTTSPVITSFQTTSAGSVYNEGDIVTVTGTYAEGTLSGGRQIMIQWGDGSASSPAFVDARTRSFRASHRYLDNGSGPDGLLNISASIAAHDGATGATAQLQARVRNAVPSVSISSLVDDNSGVLRLSSIVADAGLADALTTTWQASVPGLPSFAPVSGSGPFFDLDTSMAPNQIWKIQVSLLDDDGGLSVSDLGLLTGDATGNVITLTDDLFVNAGVTSLLVVGMDGNDIIDARSLVGTGYQLILDGGAGSDQIWGSNGNDVVILRDSGDIAGAADVSSPGDDRYVFAGAATGRVFDNSGTNVLDFSRADFGTGQGIRLDLSRISAGAATVQQISSDTTVTLQGIFSQVIGSQFADVMKLTDGM
ncbi:MAG: hypothetical protein KDA96_14930, partial [Planctomycetaceae bacterium]|nr:hypothetical protein [Planctomycetaceae bacterium]